MTAKDHNTFPNGRNSPGAFSRTPVATPGGETQSIGPSSVLPAEEAPHGGAEKMPGVAIEAREQALDSPGETLSQAEASELQACEQIIERGLKTFMEVATALMTIREHKLYRATHGTFDNYCQDRWAIQARHARRIIDAGEMAERICFEDGIPVLMLPASESQTRPLAKLPPEFQRTAWKKVIVKANGQTITAKMVEEVVTDELVAMGRLTKPIARPEGLSSTTEAAKPLVIKNAAPGLSPGTVVDVPTLETREQDLRETAKAALDKVLDLQVKIGSPDSKEAAAINTAVETLQDFLRHVDRMEKLQEARA